MRKILIAGDCDAKKVSNPLSYLRALREVDAIGAVSFADSGEDALCFADAFDALLLPGGGDLPGDHFGQSTHIACICDDPMRDASDRLLFEAFRSRQKRILGICRGCQVVNVFLGGTLHQHLPDAYHPVLWHSGNITGRHAVHVEADSLLSTLIGSGEAKINSSHHQAIDLPGDGLRIVAKAPDGIVEAVEGKDLLLLQWHPERMTDTMLPVFRWLVGAQ